MQTLTSHLRENGILGRFLSDSVDIDGLVNDLRAQLGTDAETLLPAGLRTNYPWSRVGTAFSLGMSIFATGAIPDSTRAGMLHTRYQYSLEDLVPNASASVIATHALALEPYETFYRSPGGSPAPRSLSASPQVVDDLTALLATNIALVSEHVDITAIRDEHYVLPVPNDVIQGDPDLAVRTSDAFTVVEAKTTIHPDSRTFLASAVKQVICLTIMGHDADDAAESLSCVLHLSRQGAWLPIDLPSSELHNLAVAAQTLTPDTTATTYLSRLS